MNKNDITLSRQDLYDIVWTTPLLTLSKKYNLSDSGFRKLCIRMNVPLPSAGHWMKLQHGKKVKTKPLPDHSGEHQTTTLSLRVGPTTNPMKERIEEIKNDPRLNFKIPENLTSKEPLILSSKASLTKKDNYGYRKITQDDVVCCWDALDIKVCRRNITRALIFMDTLIKLLRARGYDTILHNRETYAVIFEEKLQLKLREKMKRIPLPNDRWNQTDLIPTGILYLRLEDYPGKEWKDGDKQLEDQLPDILAKLELHADQEVKKRLERERYWAEIAEKERKEKEIIQQREQDLTDFKRLLEKAQRWHEAENLRNYISEIESRASKVGHLTEEQVNWFSWAKNKTDWYDPFIEKIDLLSGFVDQATLEPIKEKHLI